MLFLLYCVYLFDKFINLFYSSSDWFSLFFLNYLFYHSRTPGSRQPSPAEESVQRPQTLLDPNAFHQQHFQHMLNAGMDHHQHAGQLNSYHPPIMNHQMPGTVMNGVGGLQVQVRIIRCFVRFWCYVRRVDRLSNPNT